jgi:lambda family phage portal protein
MASNRPPLPQNLLDKAIAYFRPDLALRRMRERGALALAGGYTGARVDRAQLAAWKTRAGSPDSDLIPDLPKLRERSRDLARNAPVATGAIGTTVSHVVGTGLSCNPQIDAEFLGLSTEQAAAWQKDTRRRFKAWAESPDCDLSRALNFYGLQGLGFQATIESGDAFCLTPMVTRPGRGTQIALQLLEADRVCNPKGMSDSAELVDGIRIDPDTGEEIAVHVTSHHPGDLRREVVQWREVPVRGARTGRRNVLHLFRPTRPGQKRGAPLLAPIIEPLKQLGRYTDAELQAAVTSGLFSVFLKMDPQAFQDLFNEDAQGTYVERASSWSGDMESGKAVNLLPGEEPVTSNPGRPNAQFDPFVQSILVQIGMALGIPYEVLTSRFQSSYSAARGALLQAWKFFMGWRDWLATNFCQPVYELWLDNEVAAGRIAAPGYFTSPIVRHAWAGCQWVGDGPGSIDPGKEVKAAQERVNMGISTLQAESILHDGVDWETKHAQQVKEAKARKSAGMQVPGAAPPAPAPPPEPPEEPDANTRAIATALGNVASGQATAMGAIAAALERERPAPVVNVAAPVVNVAQPEVHIEPAQVNVQAGDVNIEPGAIQPSFDFGPGAFQVDVDNQRHEHTHHHAARGLVRKVPQRDADGLITSIDEQWIESPQQNTEPA